MEVLQKYAPQQLQAQLQVVAEQEVAGAEAGTQARELSSVVIFEWQMPPGEMRAGRSTVLDGLAIGEFAHGSLSNTPVSPARERKSWWRRLLRAPQLREGEAGGSLAWFGDIDAHLGYAPGEFPRTIEAWRDSLHPEDRTQVLAAIARHLQTQEPYAIECRARRKDGSYLHWTHSGTVTRDADGNPLKLVATFSNITHGRDRRALVEKRAQEEKARAESLLRTAAHLNAHLDLNQVCQAICEEAARTIGAPAAVMLFDKARDAFVPSATINMPHDYAGRYTPTVRAIYDRHVEEMGTLFLFTDAQATPDLPNHKLYREVDMRTIGIASLIREGEVLGLLKVYSFVHPRTFDENELALLQGLADQAAMAISNARFFSESQRRLANIQALRQIDVAILGSNEVNVALNVVLDQVTSRLGAHAASVLLLNPHTRTLRYVGGRGFHLGTPRRNDCRLGEGLAGRAALERRLLHVPDLNRAEVFAEDLGSLETPHALPLESPEAADEWMRSGSVASEKFVSYRAVPLVASGQVKGVLEVWHRSPLPLDEEAEEFLETLAGQAAIAIDNAHLFRDLQRSNDDLMIAYDSTLEGWSGALDLRDKETEGHSQRVTNETLRLARHMGIGDEEMVHIRRGALLHDIGKMGIPDAILLKPGSLSDDEWVVMKKHPSYAYELLSPIAFLRPALDIPYAHHEKWDGSGYPRGLSGEQIPLAARLFAVVDVWDALCSNRPYRQGWPIERVLNHIRDSSGTHFDPEVVKAFLEMHALPSAPDEPLDLLLDNTHDAPSTTRSGALEGVGAAL